MTLASLALPTLQAFTSATVGHRALVIRSHGFTLRLGTTAHAAFGPLALVPRGAAGRRPVLRLGAVFPGPDARGRRHRLRRARRPRCPAAGRPAGCLMSACLTGLQALAAKLDGAFAAATNRPRSDALRDGADARKSGGGLADRLGSDDIGTSPAAVWSVNLRTSLGERASPRPPSRGEGTRAREGARALLSRARHGGRGTPPRVPISLSSRAARPRARTARGNRPRARRRHSRPLRRRRAGRAPPAPPRGR